MNVACELPLGGQPEPNETSTRPVNASSTLRARVRSSAALHTGDRERTEAARSWLEETDEDDRDYPAVLERITRR